MSKIANDSSLTGLAQNALTHMGTVGVKGLVYKLSYNLGNCRDISSITASLSVMQRCEL